MKLATRKAMRSDCPFILELIKDLAHFEKAPEQVKVSVEQLEKDGFGEDPLYEAQILTVDNTPAGFFLYYYRYSTWKGRSLYLEDLYVKPEFRRLGLAKLAFSELSKIALDKDCGRMEWQVLDWNENAIKFYETFDCDLDGEWINCRLEGDKIGNPIHNS